MDQETRDRNEANAGQWRFAYVGIAIAAAVGALIFLACACFFTRRRSLREDQSRQPSVAVTITDQVQLSPFGHPISPSVGQTLLPREVKLTTCEAIYVIQPEDDEGVRAKSIEDGPQKCVLGLKVTPVSVTVANPSTREHLPPPDAASNIISTAEPHPLRQ
eukprot:CAMPEP_0202378850 /NCGR_PEP_ID=MMETSP1127-20130417/20875_1 /ASSEMBLY_ACC=CAM_ASM_000462 /TAXON_ID=3047 /ORGANISM="Dunaliella tertiolecta, Strain CCMP1320" /LENGTH=160 /DNA_ID=CAMNT_0048977251 /DNA_START=181 /DNA_END=663 /DNA_ORIENTATION=-